MTTSTIIKLIIGMIILGISIYLIFFKGVKPAESTINPILQQQSINLCKAKGDLAKIQTGGLVGDCDGDGYPEICDVCLGRSDADGNADGTPDACENLQMVYDSKATQKSICESAPDYKSWDEAKKKCALKSYIPC